MLNKIHKGTRLERYKRIAEIIETATDFEAEDEIEDAYSYNTGHYTRNTGTKTITLFGIPAAEAVELLALLKEGK